MKLDIPIKKVYKWGYDRKQVARNVFHIKTEPQPIAIENNTGKPGNCKNIKNCDNDEQEVIYTSIKKSKSNGYNELVDEILNLKAQELHLTKRKYDRKIQKNVSLKLSGDLKSSKKYDEVEDLIFDKASSFGELDENESNDSQFYRSIDVKEELINNNIELNKHENELQTKVETPELIASKQVSFRTFNDYDPLGFQQINYFELELGSFSPEKIRKLNDLENIWTTNWTDQELYL